jgi:hypothetical protein
MYNIQTIFHTGPFYEKARKINIVIGIKINPDPAPTNINFISSLFIVFSLFVSVT